MMIKVLADASLPGLTKAFSAPFSITRYKSNADVPALLAGHDILLCRSTLTVNQKLLGANPIKIVATASSGIDHIDQSFLSQQNITLLDAKGCNAHSVADYVLCCLAYLKIKCGISPKKAGIIGIGAVGSLVAKRLQDIGLKVICYDPPKEQQDPHFKSANQSDLFTCDLVCVHANRHNTSPHPSINLLNEAFLQQLQPGTVILNASRGGIVNEAAILKMREKVIYCTDVYLNEPHIDPRIVEFATLCTPHIAGHSIEAKERAVTLLSEKIHAFYNVPAPFNLMKSKKGFRPRLTNLSEQALLSLYNPSIETQRLKEVTLPLNEVFMSLRKAHNVRHDSVFFM